MSAFGKRTISRIKVLFKLYQYDLLKEDVDDEIYDMEFKKLLEESELTENDIDEEFVNSLYDGIIDNIQKIDRLISINLTGYEIGRLNEVDRNIIRIGVYEIVYLKTPKAIVIDEVVKLSKEYTETNSFLSSKFNNSLLDKIAKSVE